MPYCEVPAEMASRMARVFRHQNAFPDIGSVDHDFDCGNAAFSVATPYQALADTARNTAAAANLLLPAWQDGETG